MAKLLPSAADAVKRVTPVWNDYKDTIPPATGLIDNADGAGDNVDTPTETP